MRAKRYVVAILGVALAASFALPGVASAQEEKYIQAYRAYDAGNYSQAETLFREVCAEYEDAGVPWGWCHMMLGVTLANRGAAKRQEALNQLEVARELVAEDSERFQVLSSMAQIHLLESRFPQAIALADEAGQYASESQQRANLSNTKGQAYYGQDDWSNAIRELEAAGAARSGDANLHARLGRAYFELDDLDKALEELNLDKALEELNRASQIDRANRVGLYFAARIYLERSSYGQAVTLAERAIQAYPQDTNIRNLLGLSYIGAERYADAVQQFEVVIADRPTDGTAIYNLGQAHMARKNWGAAVQQYQKAQDLLAAGSVNQGNLLYDLGMSFEKLGRNEDSLRAFQDSQRITASSRVQDSIERVQERIRRAKGKQQ